MHLVALFLLLILCTNTIMAKNEPNSTFKQLASSYCLVNDYSIWLEHKESLNYFLQLARMFALDTTRIEQEIERYRLQDECLKKIEKLSTTNVKA